MFFFLFNYSLGNIIKKFYNNLNNIFIHFINNVFLLIFNDFKFPYELKEDKIEKKKIFNKINKNLEYLENIKKDTKEEICCICYENKKSYAFINCGHLCICKTCSEKVIACPMCRNKSKSIKIYL